MLTGGWHQDQEQFWVHTDVPQSYIDSRLEAEEAARVKKELAAKKKAAEKALAEGKIEKESAADGAPDFSGGSL